MKLWLICIVIALLLAPHAFAGEEEQPADSDAHSATTSAKASADVDAEDEYDEREAIIAILSHYHEVPNRRQLEAGSDEARTIVFDIAQDEDAFIFHRQRAIRALAHWPDDEVYDYLIGLLNDEETEDGLRHHLLPVLAEGFGERSLEELKQFLFEAEDPHIRISAGGAIATIPGDEAHEMLLKALQRESSPIVQRRLETYATRLR